MAAPEFTLFVKPYLEGWDNGEEGNTPITAEILNDNYDAFLLALNDWATSVGLILEEAVTDPNYVHTDNNYTTTEKNKLSGIEANANNYSLPTASESTLGGVKVDGITITIANGVISAVGGGGTDVEGNPSGTPTAVLSSIRIGQNIYSIPGGGSGGSSVSYSQILATGTKIGTITIDGVPTDIYAPTAPTKTSDLTNDSNFVSDASYVHTDNNYTTSEKNKLADLNQVEANPSSGTSAGDLTSIEIDGTKYNIPSGGGGGTTVIANPSGSATAGDLNKLQVGNDIYSIPSGGGTTVVANPQETATEELTAIQIGETVYSLPSGEQLIDLIPRMSSDTTPSGECSASYVYSDRYAYYGFTTDGRGDMHRASQFWYNAGSNANEYIQYDFGRTVTVHSILFGSADSSTVGGSRGVKPQFSMDGTTWVDDETISLSTYEYKEYELFEPRVCQYMRLVCTTATQYTLSGIQAKGVVGGSTGSSGHTILNDGGTALAQEDDLQFKGVYSHDDSTNGKTVVEVTRVMNSAEYALLSDAEKKGVILVSDAPDPSASGFTDYEGTLTAGQTSLTITGLEIDNTKLFDYYTDILGVNPTNIVVTNGHVTLTFPAQQTDMSVIVSVRSKTHIDKPFDINLSDFITDKIWKYYDSANWSDATSDGSKITIAGGEDKSDWTTATWVCIDLTQYPVPNNLSKLKIHLPSIETLGYSGVCVVTDSTKFGPGSNGGSDTMIRKSRLEISSGIYVLGDPSLGINETDYTLEIPCAKNDLSRYLYIGAADGVEPSWDGSTNAYNNALNGSFDVKIDGVWYE